MNRSMRTTLHAACMLTAGLFAFVPASACTITATAVAFGDYNTTDSVALDGVGSTTVDCRKPSATITIGTGGSGTYSSRRMTSGSNYLEYNLYTDATRQIVWGDGSGGTGTASVSTKGTTVFTIYGRIFPLQNVAAASYADSMVVTVNF